MSKNHDNYITFEDDIECVRYSQGYICRTENEIRTLTNPQTGKVLISKDSLRRYFEMDKLDIEAPYIKNGSDELIEANDLNNALYNTSVFTHSKTKRKLLQDTLNLMMLCN